MFCIQLFKKMKKSEIIFIVFISIILTFGLCYYIADASHWKGNQSQNIVDCLYYSVVTITTLGFGDICPSSTSLKALTCVEVILGVVIIGVFLNNVSAEQAKKVSDNNNELLLKQSKKKTKGLLHNLHSLIRIYLLQCAEMVTPIHAAEIPEDIFNFEFKWKYCNMCDLYEKTLLLFNPIDSIRIDNYFRHEHKLFDELRYLSSNTDLSIYPDLQREIQKFINNCLSFTFEYSLIKSKELFLDNSDKEFRDYIRDYIKKSPEPEKCRPGNLFNQYYEFYWHIQNLVHSSIEIEKLANKVLNEPS